MRCIKRSLIASYDEPPGTQAREAHTFDLNGATVSEAPIDTVVFAGVAKSGVMYMIPTESTSVVDAVWLSS